MTEKPHRLVFGLDRLCPACEGKGTEHAYHGRSEREACPHVCLTCKGKGVIR